MRKIRVLHSLVRVGSGGVEQRRLLLAKYLDPSKYEQAIICTDVYGELVDKFASLGVKVYVVGIFANPFDFNVHRNAISVIKDFKPDIIHGAVFEGVNIAAVSGFISRVPVIIIEETSHPLQRSWKGKCLFKMYSMLSKKVIAVSPPVREYLINNNRISSNKVCLINNAVDFNFDSSLPFRKKIRSQLGIKDNEILIGSVGRLEDKVKNFSIVIDALKLIRDINPLVKLVIVGDGDDYDSLVQKAIDSDLIESILFTGYDVDVHKYYAAMDIFCLASITESFGLVLVEAMLAKLPIVATNVGGIPYVVDNHESGILVEPLCVYSLVDALSELINNPNEMLRMGSNGKMRAEIFFSPERYANEVQKLYESLV